MDEQFKFILERIEKLRDDFRDDLHQALSPEVKNRKDLEKRVRALEGKYERWVGISLVAIGLINWASKHI